MLCIAAAGVVTALATTSFTLGWTHSVERTHWEERWRIESGQLAIVSASVEGSGAGIAVPEDAVWADGVWTYAPTLPPMASSTWRPRGRPAQAGFCAARTGNALSLEKVQTCRCACGLPRHARSRGNRLRGRTVVALDNGILKEVAAKIYDLPCLADGSVRNRQANRW